MHVSLKVFESFQKTQLPVCAAYTSSPRHGVVNSELGLYRNNGKESGNYYTRIGYIRNIGVILGLYNIACCNGLIMFNPTP